MKVKLPLLPTHPSCLVDLKKKLGGGGGRSGAQEVLGEGVGLGLEQAIPLTVLGWGWAGK